MGPQPIAEGTTDRCTVCAYIELEATTEEVRGVSVPDRVAEPVASSPVLYEVRDTGVAVLTLNRPERMNGWGGGLATTFYCTSRRRGGRPGRPGHRGDR